MIADSSVRLFGTGAGGRTRLDPVLELDLLSSWAGKMVAPVPAIAPTAALSTAIASTPAPRRGRAGDAAGGTGLSGGTGFSTGSDSGSGDGGMYRGSVAIVSSFYAGIFGGRLDRVQRPGNGSQVRTSCSVR